MHTTCKPRWARRRVSNGLEVALAGARTDDDPRFVCATFLAPAPTNYYCLCTDNASKLKW